MVPIPSLTLNLVRLNEIACIFGFVVVIVQKAKVLM